MTSCRGLVLLLSAMVFAVVFSGCIKEGMNVSEVSGQISNISVQGKCVTGTVTFCKEENNPCNCPNTWEPVCGVDGKTYPNECAANCLGIQFTKGACGLECAKFNEPCGIIATTGAAPIKRECCEGTCVNNVCQKPDYYACPDGTVTAELSKCSSEAKPPEEQCLCLANWDPVCGVDGVTYENGCAAKCKGVEIAYVGPCENICVQEGMPCDVVAGVATNYVSEQVCCGGMVCINGICQKPHEYTCPDGTKAENPNNCPPNNCGCVKEWNPVCVDGVIYPSKCFAMCAGANLTHLVPGECNATSVCSKAGEKCYREVERCKVDATTGKKYCENITESNCCEGLVCSDGYCKKQIEECALEGENCNNKDCCGGLECAYAYAGYSAQTNVQERACIRRECRNAYERCNEDKECCSGHCVNNYCASQGGCFPNGKACEKNGQCCSGWCKDGICTKREHDCLKYGEPCKLNEQCCSGICDPETYTCIDKCANVGEECSSEKPCCPKSGAYCSDGICKQPDQTCNPEGARCGTPAEPNYFAAVLPSYGNCCPGLECINSYCKHPPACDCPEIYSPVCGSNGKTYGNLCRLRCAGVQLAYEGPCRNETACKPAYERCGKVYDSEKNETYYYGECCGGLTCWNNICLPPLPECPTLCRQRGERCGIPPITRADGLSASYGNCCEGLSCVNNVCMGSNECVPVGGSCYVPPATATHAVPANYTGNCCEGAVCANGVCREIQRGCRKQGERCTNDNDCCYGGCVDNVCAPTITPCKKTYELCTPERDKCCEPTDACVQNPSITTHMVYWCAPQATPTPTPTPSPTPSCKYEYCKDGIFYTGCSYNAQANACTCTTRVVCVSKRCNEEGTACGPGVTPTPTPTPTCKQRGQSCNPQTDACCEQGDSCVRNPNIVAAVAYWCAPQATPTPTPTPAQMCSDTDDDTSNNSNIYKKGTATGKLVGDGYGSFTDYCISSKTIREYDCLSPGQMPDVVVADIQCPQNMACVEGACVQR